MYRVAGILLSPVLLKSDLQDRRTLNFEQAMIRYDEFPFSSSSQSFHSDTDNIEGINSSIPVRENLFWGGLDGDHGNGCHGEEENDKLIWNDLENLSSAPVTSGIIRKKRVYKKRNRPRKRNPLYIPRVLKRDFRLHFPEMMVNVFNAHDSNILRSFFRTFSSACIAVTKPQFALDFLTGNQNNHIFHQNKLESWALHGAEWMVYHSFLLNRINPDQVIRINSSFLTTRPGTAKSSISITLLVESTRIYDIHDEYFVDSLLALMDRDGKISMCSLDDSANLLDPMDYYYQTTGTAMPLLATPQAVKVEASATYHFDENKRIELVEISRARLLQ